MPHRSRLAGFIIDCETGELDQAATFWSGALNLPVIDPDSGGEGTYAELAEGPGGLHIEVQKVRHPSRVHLDIEADDVDAEAERLEKLGARKIAFVKRWWVMEAPTGQRFCVVRTKFPERGVAWNDWDAAFEACQRLRAPLLEVHLHLARLGREVPLLPMAAARDALIEDRLAHCLELAGSDPLTTAWAREHHRPAADWTVAPDIAAALKAADDD